VNLEVDVVAKYVERLVVGYARDGAAAGGEYMSELASESVPQRFRPVTSHKGPTERSEGER
jgi:hypothetical protein